MSHAQNLNTTLGNKLLTRDLDFFENPVADMVAEKNCSRFWDKFAQIMSRMFFGRFWLQNKDLGASLGAIEQVFRAGSVPIGPRVPKIAIFFLVPNYFLTNFLHDQIAHRHMATGHGHW